MPILVRIGAQWWLWTGNDQDEVVLGMGVRLLQFDGYAERTDQLKYFDQASLSEQSERITGKTDEHRITVKAFVNEYSQEFTIPQSTVDNFRFGFDVLSKLLKRLEPPAQHTWLITELDGVDLTNRLVSSDYDRYWNELTAQDSQYGEMIRGYLYPWTGLFYFTVDPNRPVALKEKQLAEHLLKLLSTHPEGFWNMSSFGITTQDKVRLLSNNCRPGRVERVVTIHGIEVNMSYRSYQLYNSFNPFPDDITQVIEQDILVQVNQSFWLGSGTIEDFFGTLWSLRYSVDRSFAVLWPPLGLERETDPKALLKELLNKDYFRRLIPTSDDLGETKSLQLFGGSEVMVSDRFIGRFKIGYYSGLSLLKRISELQQDSSSRRRHYRDHDVKQRYPLYHGNELIRAPHDSELIRFEPVDSTDELVGSVILSFWASEFQLPMDPKHGPIMAGQAVEWLDQLTSFIIAFHTEVEEIMLTVDCEYQDPDYVNGILYGARKYQICLINKRRYDLLRSERATPRTIVKYVDATTRNLHSDNFFDAFLLNYPFYPTMFPKHYVSEAGFTLEIHDQNNFTEGVFHIIEARFFREESELTDEELEQKYRELAVPIRSH